MPDFIIEILKEINIAQLVAIGLMFWFFYSRLNGKIDKLEEKFELKFEKIDHRFDKVDQRFERLEERLIRLEIDVVETKTIVRMKEGCMIKDEKQFRKAE